MARGSYLGDIARRARGGAPSITPPRRMGRAWEGGGPESVEAPRVQAKLRAAGSALPGALESAPATPAAAPAASMGAGEANSSSPLDSSPRLGPAPVSDLSLRSIAAANPDFPSAAALGLEHRSSVTAARSDLHPAAAPVADSSAGFDSKAGSRGLVRTTTSTRVDSDSSPDIRSAAARDVDRRSVAGSDREARSAPISETSSTATSDTAQSAPLPRRTVAEPLVPGGEVRGERGAESPERRESRPSAPHDSAGDGSRAETASARVAVPESERDIGRAHAGQSRPEMTDPIAPPRGASREPRSPATARYTDPRGRGGRATRPQAVEGIAGMDAALRAALQWVAAPAAGGPSGAQSSPSSEPSSASGEPPNGLPLAEIQRRSSNEAPLPRPAHDVPLPRSTSEAPRLPGRAAAREARHETAPVPAANPTPVERAEPRSPLPPPRGPLQQPLQRAYPEVGEQSRAIHIGAVEITIEKPKDPPPAPPPAPRAAAGATAAPAPLARGLGSTIGLRQG